MTMHLSSKTRALLLLAAMIAAAQLLVAPLYSWQQEARSSIVNVRKQLSRLDSLEKSRKEMEETAAGMDELLAEAKAYFRTDVATAEALQLNVQKFLEALTAKIGVSVQRMEWIYVTGDDLVVQTPVRIHFKSNLVQLYELLQKVESYSELLTVDALSVSAIQDKELTGTLDISAYSLKEGKEAKVAGPAPETSETQ